jgi:photosystem II stability/assembly factor-like uncharacterized protein
MSATTTICTRLVRPGLGAAMLLAWASLAAHAQPEQVSWQPVDTHSTASFRGLSVARDGSVWVGGAHGTVLRSTDAGHTWTTDSVAGASTLDFRGVAAIDSTTAYAMVSAFDTGRIYKTTDHGRSWTMQYRDERPGVFLDGIACWDGRRCVAAGDPMAGHFVIVTTDDGGTHWSRLGPSASPSAATGEATFAASNTSVIVAPGGRAWIATGGGAQARVWRSSDFGATWRVADTPLAAGSASAGAFSLAFCDNGVVVGGNYKAPDGTGAHVAFSTDGGTTWKASDEAHVTPYLSAVTCHPSSGGARWVAVGPTGTFSAADGLHWSRASRSGFNAVAFVGDGLVAVGDKGSVAWAGAGQATGR